MEKATFQKWEIKYVEHKPLNYKCPNCYLMISPIHGICPDCGYQEIVLTNELQGMHPIILWHGESEQFSGLAFGIPLSSSAAKNIFLSQTAFTVLLPAGTVHNKKGEPDQRPSLAMIHQSRPYNVEHIRNSWSAGIIASKDLQDKIQDCLLNWLVH